MVRARRGFLDRGYYRPLSDAINECVHDHLMGRVSSSSERFPLCVAEVGCGEGYYIGRLKRYLDGPLGHRGMCYFGMDISKEAVRLAAKRYTDIRFIVASVRRELLFSSHSIQVLLNIFAPRNGAEFDRIVARDGVLLVAIPGPDHLLNLRSGLGLLGIEAHKEQRVVEQFGGTFQLADRRAIAYEMRLTGEELLDLIQMTPNYWHASRETLEAIKATRRVQTEASFAILQFHR
jgi:23S rRNA (guanine745-N1)-methyltransferase